MRSYFLSSKFLWEGSQRVGVSSSQNTELEYSAFVRPDGSVVLVILNRYTTGFYVQMTRQSLYLTVYFLFFQVVLDNVLKKMHYDL